MAEHPDITLAEIAENPALALGLAPEAITGMMSVCGAAMGALQAAAALHHHDGKPEQDDLIPVDQAAAILSVSPQWLYRRAHRLNLAVKLGPGTTRISRKALDGYIALRRSRPAGGRKKEERGA